MIKWKYHTPAGVQDYLPDECYNKRKIESKIRSIFSYSGYNEVELPIFEYFDVFSESKSSIKQEQMFKFCELGGRILVLRPDNTMPIARIAATKLSSYTVPMRLSYISNVYRYQELEYGKQREVAQAGIELIGVEGPEADAEVISTAIEIFRELGLKDFRIDIGQVDFYKGLIEQANLDYEQAEEIRSLIDSKNMLALESYLKDLSISDSIKEVLLGLPKLYGNGDILEQALELSDNPRCQNAIKNIYKVNEILKDYGLDNYITFDLGMVQSLNYYTGIIFRGITKEIGYPICGGGRYDSLVSEFGYDLPATGFAIGLKRVLMALEKQQALKAIPSVDCLIYFDADSRKVGFELAQSLRKIGRKTEIFLSDISEKDPLMYAKSKGIPKVYKIEGCEIQELQAGE